MLLAFFIHIDVKILFLIFICHWDIVWGKLTWEKCGMFRTIGCTTFEASFSSSLSLLSSFDVFSIIFTSTTMQENRCMNQNLTDFEIKTFQEIALWNCIIGLIDIGLPRRLVTVALNRWFSCYPWLCQLCWDRCRLQWHCTCSTISSELCSHESNDPLSIEQIIGLNRSQRRASSWHDSTAKHFFSVVRDRLEIRRRLLDKEHVSIVISKTDLAGAL